MTITKQQNEKVPFRLRLIDGVLLVVTIVLSGSVLLTLQEPMFNLGAMQILQTVEGAIHQVYSMSALYNVWLFIGGGIWLTFVIGSIEYYSKRLGRPKMRGRLLKTCVILGILIAVNVAVGYMTM